MKARQSLSRAPYCSACPVDRCSVAVRLSRAETRAVYRARSAESRAVRASRLRVLRAEDRASGACRCCGRSVNS